jgi:hypothetical protein
MYSWWWAWWKPETCIVLEIKAMIQLHPVGYIYTYWYLVCFNQLHAYECEPSSKQNMAFPVGKTVMTDLTCVIFILTCGTGQSEPVGTAPTNGVPAPEGWQVWDVDGIIACKENKTTRRELAPVAQPTAYYTYEYKRSKLGPRKGKPIDNILSNGTAFPALNWNNLCKYCFRSALQNDISELYQWKQLRHWLYCVICWSRRKTSRILHLTVYCALKSRRWQRSFCVLILHCSDEIPSIILGAGGGGQKNPDNFFRILFGIMF